MKNDPTSKGISDTVQKALTNVQFPASKQDVVRIAQQNNVPDPIVQKLRNMPGDKYNGPQDVIRAVQQLA
jgi:pyruvate carboxylase